jgi:hypothetical protein
MRHGGANLWAGIPDQERKFVVGILSDASPFGFRKISPQLTDAEARPLSEEGVLEMSDVVQTIRHNVCRVADDLTGLEAFAQHGKDKCAHGLVLVENTHANHREDLLGLHDGGKIGVAVILDEVLLARNIDSEYPSPDKDHDRFELWGR